MADLRLVGVHDDGEHLLLSGPDGDIYLLPLDEALRTAVGRGTQRSTRAPQLTGSRMTPREIQGLIRAGATAADVAEQSGLSLEQVRRYEGPVLAEREYIAAQARTVEVASATPHNDGYRAAFGDHPATLEQMVRHRLAAFGIDPRSLRWDAWRENAGAWTVTADFDPGTERAATSIGQPAPAQWRFHAGRKSLHNANRWAQQLSELEPLDSPVPERRLSAVADQPFDIEASAQGDGGAGTASCADGTTRQSTTETPVEEPTPEDTPDDGQGLLDMLRNRRGVRLGLDEDGDDELAAMLGTHVPGAHPRDEALYSDPEETPDEVKAATGAKERLRSIPFLKLAPSLDMKHHEAESGSVERVNSVSEVSTETREVVLSGEPSAPPSKEQDQSTERQRPTGQTAAQNSSTETDQPEPGPSDSEVAARLERKAAGKPKRSSVPSWDEIVFGTKGD